MVYTETALKSEHLIYVVWCVSYSQTHAKRDSNKIKQCVTAWIVLDIIGGKPVRDHILAEH